MTRLEHYKIGGTYDDDVRRIREAFPNVITSNIEAIFWWEKMSEVVYKANWLIVNGESLKSLKDFFYSDKEY